MTEEELIATYPTYTVYVMFDENSDVKNAHTSTFYAEKGKSYADCCVVIGKSKYFIETQDKYLFWAVSKIEKLKLNHLCLNDIKSDLVEMYYILKDGIDDLSNILKDGIDDLYCDEEEKC